MLDGHLTLGRGNRIFPFASVGVAPQDLKYAGEPTRCELGDNNTIRESVTISRGTVGGGGVTRLGSGCLIMAYVHIGHDCQIGDGCILANAATLAGHVTIEEYAVVGALCPVHQYCRIGRYSYIGGGTTITQDVLPYSLTCIERNNHAYGLNKVGLERRGFTPAQLKALRQAYRLLQASKLNTTDALAAIRATLLAGGAAPTTELSAAAPVAAYALDPSAAEHVRYLADFIAASPRGIIKYEPTAMWKFVLLFATLPALSQTLPAPATPIDVYDGFETPTLSPLWETTRIAPGALTLQSAITRAGHGAVQLTIHANDKFEAGINGDADSERDELTEARRLTGREGVPYEQSFSLFFPADFPIVPVRLVVAQWKQDCAPTPPPAPTTARSSPSATLVGFSVSRRALAAAKRLSSTRRNATCAGAGSTSASRCASPRSQPDVSRHGSTASRSSITPASPPTRRTRPPATPLPATSTSRWASTAMSCPSP